MEAQARRKALEAMEKAELVEIVLRLQDQIRAARGDRELAFEDVKRLAKAQFDEELAEKQREAVSV